MSIVVSDTSPIRALHHLELLDLLPQIYDRVLIPDAVVEELTRPSRRFPALEISSYAFLIIKSPSDISALRIFEAKLDPGETAAIALAMEMFADYLLIDERNGRRAAKILGLTAVGVLGVLLEAKARHLIGPITPLITRLQTELDFRLSLNVIKHVLRQAGEP